MTRVQSKDVRRGVNLRWLLCLAGLALPAAPAAGADAPGAGAWDWVGRWWSVPPPGSPVRALVPADPTEWGAGFVLPGAPAKPTVERSEPSAAADALDPWSAMGFRPDGWRRTAGRKTDLDWGQLSSRVVLTDPNAPDPYPARAWQTEESLRLPVAGPVFLVGQVESRSDSQDAQIYKLETRTGVGSQVPFLPGGEVQLRGGRSFTNTDPDSFLIVPGPNQSRLFLEVMARCQLVGPLKLEYTGAALTAPSPTGRDQLKQDVRVALPLGDRGQFHVGAKYRWEAEPGQATWAEWGQLYLGLQLKH